MKWRARARVDHLPGRRQQQWRTGRQARPLARGCSKIPKLPAVHTLQVSKDSQNAVRIVSAN